MPDDRFDGPRATSTNVRHPCRRTVASVAAANSPKAFSAVETGDLARFLVPHAAVTLCVTLPSRASEGL